MLLVRGDSAGLSLCLPAMLQAMRRMPEPDQHYALVNAVVQARTGDTARARETLAGIGDGARMRAPMMLATIADVALLADDTARFADLLARLTPARGRNTAWGPFAFVCGPPYDAIVGSLLWRLGRREEALAAFDAALALARRSGAAASGAWVELALACGQGKRGRSQWPRAPRWLRRERARITVQRRVREAIKKIGDHEAELGRYLEWTIRTGTYCAYEPEGRKTAG
jgi:hypothetical protein